MVTAPGRVDNQDTAPSDDAALLLKACPELEEWPMRWQRDQSDIALGAAIVNAFKPFLLDLLHHKRSKTTVNRHLRHLWMLGGEIIRRRHEDPTLERLCADRLIAEFIKDDGGPLVWPRIAEAEQNAFDATCRKLYRYLNPSTGQD